MRTPSLETRVWMELQLRGDRASPVTGAMIEPGAVCNLRCPFCPTGRGELGLPAGLMSLEEFRDTLDRLGPDLERVLPFHWGEPFFNPALYDMIAEAAGRGLETHISTNFSLREPHFSAAHAERLVRSGLTTLNVSFAGVTQRTYELYRAGGELELVLRNIRLVREAQRRLRSRRPEVVWLYHVSKQNLGEKAAARRKARELGVRIVFKTLNATAEAKAEWEAPRPRAGGDEQPGLPGRLCLQTWNMPIVHSDGTVLPCCVVHEKKYALGNIRSEPLAEIWNKPLIRDMRRYVRTGERPDGRLPCYGCPSDPHGSAP